MHKLTKKKRKNEYLSFLLTICLIITIIGIIFHITIDSIHKNQNTTIYLNPLKINTVMDYKWHYTTEFNATWVSDEEILTKDISGHIVLLNVKTNNKSILAYNTMQNVRFCYDYNLSADKKYLLVAYNYTKIFKYSYTAFYDVINIKNGKQVTLRNSYNQPRQLRLAKWTANNSSLIIVDDYNIFYIPTAVQPNTVHQLTFDGSKDFYNGIPDWAYEEEILESNCAVWLSPAGTNLVYASFNDTLVPKIKIPYYGIPDTLYDQYSHLISFHYPKVTNHNPDVELFFSSLNVKDHNHSVKQINPPKDFSKEVILKNVLWSDDSNIFVLWMNRIQNEAQLVHYIVNDTIDIKHVHKFKQDGGWLTFDESLLIGPEHQIALIYSTTQDDGDKYRHICIVNHDGSLKPLTSGKFTVVKLLKWDLKSNFIYYLATIENKPEDQYLFKISTNSSSTSECMTCGSSCAFSKAYFSEGGSYYVHTCAGPNIPDINILKISGETVLQWDTNRSLTKKLQYAVLPKVVFMTVPLKDGFEARVKLTIPPKVDITSTNKYPMMVYAYAGPDSNLALNVFVIDYNTYFSTAHNVIIAEIDGRGSGRKGDSHLFANYKKLGTVEIEDQITVTKYLQDNLSYIDKSNTAIWGWSYGGYVAGMVLAKDEEKRFKCGLSVAPITDWLYYDTFYTERYLDLYNKNFRGYRNASLIYNAEGLRGKDYMIIHGTLDDNVHFQHTALLSRELQHNRIPFRHHIYVDKKHSMYEVQHHLYQTITKFFTECFQH
ncbi:venom dipeptidyl peptidase 4-like isoform X2 [Daktulosphaira vitifoliae]|nr:venom dipeptidyl peptidase 4-like isoform X2 [Daktulosphaira vitifoliae]